MAGVTVRVSPAEMSVAPGGNYEFSVIVANTGSRAGTFRLSARGIDPAWVSFSPPALHLQSGQESSARLSISIPYNAALSSTSLVIRVASTGARSILGETSVALSAPPSAPATVINSVQTPLASTPTFVNDVPTERIGFRDFDAETGSKLKIAIIGAGAIALLLLGFGAVYLLAFRGGTPSATPFSDVQSCVAEPSSQVSLVSDDRTTAIILTDPATPSLRILRTEPGDVLPGLFSPLLSLSSDGSRLAYVTASNPMMDDAQIWYIDVANPGEPHLLASVKTGFWPTRPVWSQDGQQLAFVKVADAAAEQSQLELWIVNIGGQPAKVPTQARVTPQNFYGSAAAPLCWGVDNRTLIFTSSAPAPVAVPMQVQVDVKTGQFETVEAPVGSPVAAVTPNATPTATPNCGVPVFSQNDPAWRERIMQAGGDSIGGFGCALTSTAMLLNYYGVQITPEQLNQCLGPQADPIFWSRAPGCTGGAVSGGDRFEFSWAKLDDVLKSGQPAIVGMIRGQTGMHFVVVTSGGGGAAANYAVTDPWDGTTSKSLQHFFNAGYNPAWIITYNGPGKVCTRATVVSGAAPEISGVSDGGVYREPVTISLSGAAGDVDSASVANLSMSDGGPAATPSVSASPSSGGTPTSTPSSGTGVLNPPLVLVNKPVVLTPIQGSLTLDQDGVYYVLIKHKTLESVSAG